MCKIKNINYKSDKYEEKQCFLKKINGIVFIKNKYLPIKI